MANLDSRERARAWLVARGKRPIPNGVGGYRWVLPDSIPDAGRPECLPAAVFWRLKSTEVLNWNFRSRPAALVAAIDATAEAIESGELDITK